MTVYILQCTASVQHTLRGEHAVRISESDPWREAIEHNRTTGHAVSVYRCQGGDERLVLRMVAR